MKISVVKIGGNVLDTPGSLERFVKAFAAMENRKVLVHGGGKIATALGERLGIASQYIDGRRVTDKQTLDLVTMVYGGLINKQLVAALQAAGCNAIGLSGADGNVMPATRRQSLTSDFGYVGDIDPEGIGAGFLADMLGRGMTPVLSPLTHDMQGSMLNTNADTIARAVSVALSAFASVSLVYCFEKEGVLAAQGAGARVLPTINKPAFLALKNQGIISSGMIPKLDNAFAAAAAGVHSVRIGAADDLTQLISGQTGTVIL